MLTFLQSTLEVPVDGTLARYVIYALVATIVAVIPAMAKILHTLYKERLSDKDAQIKELQSVIDYERQQKENFQAELNHLVREFTILFQKFELQ